MSEMKKRSRKSKIEIRDFDIEEAENTILQSITQFSKPDHSPENSQGDSSPKIYDHTYALCNDHLTPTSSAFQLSVKVEVEEFDESLITDISPKIPSNSIPKSIRVFPIDLEKMYKISDHINWISTNPADKYLSIELKNIWGRVLKPEEVEDPYNMAIQKAIYVWNHAGYRNKSLKESPLFYQCYICQIAWWHLTLFADHIRIHNLDKMKIYHIGDKQESHIVASQQNLTEISYIPIEGNCFRCGNPYNHHVKSKGEMYRCKKCDGTYETCSLLLQHYCLGKNTDERRYSCNLCLASFCTDNELELHMITGHTVRSDVPVWVNFKSCNVCHKKYQSFYTHMCIKSSLCSSCKYCYRKFHTRTLQVAHYEVQEGNYMCKICDAVLPAKCMETEHMLTHSENFRLVYKCINFACPPTLLFPDEQSIKQHKVLYHKQKFDKRRTFCEKMLIPKQCFKPNWIQVTDCSGEDTGIRLKKIDALEPEVPDWCVRNYVVNKQTDTHVDKTNHNNIIIKQELEELKPVEDDSQDESQYGQMDYAEMLSKVFKVSDAVLTPRLDSADNIRTQIKIEPSDPDFESLIDTLEDSITIKQEPIDPAFEDVYQTDSCQNDQHDTYQSDSLESIQNDNNKTDNRSNDGPLNVNCQTDACHISIQDVRIKTEPQDCEIDSECDTDVAAAVKMEPEDIKKEILECSEVNKHTGDNIIAAEEILTIPKKKVAKIKKVKKNPNSLLKSCTNEFVKFELPPQSFKSLLNRNCAKDETVDAKKIYNDINKTDNDINKTDSDINKTDSDIDKTDCDINETKSNHSKSFMKRGSRPDNNEPKIKTLKFDEHGMKIKKLYRCAKCGYTERHKLFRLHQRSFCKYSHSGDKNNKFLCSKCNTTFGSLKIYLLHFVKHGYGVLNCPCCYLKFELIKDLIPHFHKHVKLNYVNCWMISDESETTKKLHRCRTCRQIVAIKDYFSHWESHFKLRVENVEPEKPVACTEAEQVGNKKNLPPATLHLALQQLRAESREKDCLVCYRKFSRRYDLKRHIIEHLLLDAYTKRNSIPGLMLRCQICLEEHLRAEQYKFHMREHGALPVYRCELCNKTFSDSSNFAKHKKIHNMRVLICDICNKKFHAKHSLEKHVIMHMTTDPIKCEFCERQFYSASQHNKHVNLVHMRPLQFRCILCDMSFDTYRKKWDHAWAVHKERKQKSDCPICLKEFRRYIDVKNHAKAEHQLELSFYNIKSEGVMNNVNIFCQIKKKKKK